MATEAPTSSAPAEPRAGGVGDEIDILDPAVRLRERGAGKRQQAADVVARGELRHHAAVERVQLHLRVQRVGEQPVARVVQRHAGLVAGSLDAEDQHGWGGVGEHLPREAKS